MGKGYFYVVNPEQEKGGLMKVNRHKMIVELIGKYEIETQEELAKKLNEAGYQVTQATDSEMFVR